MLLPIQLHSSDTSCALCPPSPIRELEKNICRLVWFGENKISLNVYALKCSIHLLRKQEKVKHIIGCGSNFSLV